MNHVLIKAIDLRVTRSTDVRSGITIIVELGPVPGHEGGILSTGVFDKQRQHPSLSDLRDHQPVGILISGVRYR